MRSTGSRFTPGIWGFRVCSLNVAFASAAVRNRSREVAMAVPMANFAKVVISLSFKRRVASFRVACVALCDIPTCFLTCRKSKAQYLRVVFKRWVAFLVAGAALWWPPWSFCVADAALQTCRVACFLQIAMSRLRQAVPTCKFRGRRGILWGVMQIDGSLTRHRFWGSKFWSSKKKKRKTLILKLQSVKNSGSLARNAGSEFPICLVFMLWCSCGVAVSMGEAAKPLIFEQVLMPFCVAGVALCDILTCLQKCRMSFCVQKMSRISPGRRSTLGTSIIVLRGRYSTLDVCSCVFFANRVVSAGWSGDNVQIAWQAKDPERVILRSRDCILSRSVVCSNVILRGRRNISDTPRFTLWTWLSTLYTLHFTLHILHFTLRTLHCTLYTPHSTLYTPQTTLYTPHSTLYTLHSTLYTSPSMLRTLHYTLHTLHFTPCSTLDTPHFTLHTLHFRLDPLHSKLYTLHFTLYTPHFTLYTPHSTLYTLHFTLYTLHCTLYTPHSTLYTPHSRLYTPHYTLYTLHSTLYTSHSRFTLCTTHSTLYTLHFTPYTPHSTLYTLHSTLYTLDFTLLTLHSFLRKLHFTLRTLHSTLNTLHSTLHTLHLTLCTLHSTLHTSHFTLYTPHSALHTLHFTLYNLHSTLYT